MGRKFIALVFSATMVAGQLQTASATQLRQGLPSGRVLVNQMRATLMARNSFHLHGSLTGTSSGQTVLSGAVQGDASARARSGKAVISLQGATGAQRVTTVAVGNHVAYRFAGDTWQCGAPAGLGQVVQSFFGIPQVTSAQTLGTGTVTGVPVWRVRAYSVLRISGRARQVHATLYIAKADHTLLRFVSHVSIAYGGIPLREAVDLSFTHYGEAISVSLPAACRS